MKSKKPGLLDLVKSCTRLLDDKKAADLRVLDVSGQSSITDYLIAVNSYLGVRKSLNQYEARILQVQNEINYFTQ